MSNFEAKVQAHWTEDRLKKLTAGHKYLILPNTAPALLRTLGLLNQDATMSADSRRKFIQVNHLFSQFQTHFTSLNAQFKTVRVLDAGCGSSFLTFILGWAYKELWKHQALLVGVDGNAKLIEKNKRNAELMNLNSILHFKTSSLESFDWFKEVAERPHAVVALHACNTATDDAIAMGVQLKADFIAVAPCCQAELAKEWKQFSSTNSNHPLRAAFHNPHLRREIAAHFTDLMRVLILRGHGYEVTTTEFTLAHATPKNTLIMATRRGHFHKESQKEYAELVAHLGGAKISLQDKIPFV